MKFGLRSKIRKLWFWLAECKGGKSEEKHASAAGRERHHNLKQNTPGRTNLLRPGEEALEVELGLLAPSKRDARVDVVKSGRAERYSRQFLGKLHLSSEIVYLFLLGVHFFLIRFVLFQLFEDLQRRESGRASDNKMAQQVAAIPFPFPAAAFSSRPVFRRNFWREFCSDYTELPLESCNR